MPLVSLLLLTLPVGASLIWLVPDARKARWIALLTAGADLVVAMTLVWRFDVDSGGFQFVEQANWIPSLNIHYLVGVDGITLLFLPLTVLLCMGVVLASWNSVRSLPRLYYSLLLLLESATLGVFCAMDTLLFFLFWELTLVPLYFLVSLWGIGPNRRFAAAKYTLLMLAGGVPLLFGFLLLGFNHAAVTGAGLGFDYQTLLATPADYGLQLTVFLLLLLGFAFKTPVVPLHSWLPLMSMEGPVAVTALLTGLKLGAFGILRYAVPLAPEAALQLHWLLAGIGMLGMLYGTLLALRQTNLRRMLAFASIAHVGLVLLGLSSFTLQGLQGAVYQLLNFTVAAGGAFLMVGMLHHRIGTTDLVSLGGAARSMPLLASFFLLFSLAGMGIPGTSGFPAELLILVSAIDVHLGAGLLALAAAVIGAAYVLGSYRRAYFGPLVRQPVGRAEDLCRRELLVALAFALVVLIGGLWPSLVLDTTAPAAEAWVQQLSNR